MSSSVGRELEQAPGEFGADGVERRDHRCDVVVGEDVGIREASRVCPTPGDVVGGEALVERQAQRVLPELLGGALGESPVPQRRRRRADSVAARRDRRWVGEGGIGEKWIGLGHGAPR